MKVFDHNLRTVLGSFLCSWLIATPVWADDTEIYFGGSTNVTVKPNVLFVLDTSGSMTSTDGGSTTRLDRMKSSLIDILNNIQDVNVGLMRFSNPGGPILYPVTDIDATLTSTVQQDALNGSTSSRISSGNDDVEMSTSGVMDRSSLLLEMTRTTIPATTTISTRVQTSADDAEENSSTGTMMYLTSGDLELTKANGSTPQLVGIRFADVNVPSGATITSASIEFTIDEQQAVSADPVTVLVSAQAHDDPPGFTSSSYNISSRSKTTANVTWAITDNPAVGATLTTPNLSAVIQELVDRGGWSDNNAIAFIIEHVSGTGVRWPESYDGGALIAPKLNVTYTTLNTTQINNRINSDTDNAVQASNGNVGTNIQKINISESGNPVGFRFTGVNVPSGATITDARLVFEIDDENPNDVTLLISGEDADSPTTFTNSNNVTSRTKTSANSSWAINTNPAEGNNLYSPNLSGIVQEIVNRSSWSSGNSMAFIVEHSSGSGYRTIESHKGDSSSAAQLLITYSLGSSTTENQTLGLRFNSINIPQGATISSASLSLTAGASNSLSTNLVFHGEGADNSAQFSTSANDLDSTNRPRTTANVGWNAAGTLSAWSDGTEYQAPDLTSIIQEIVDRSGWCGGNSMSLIISGTGLRTAKSYENSPSQAAQLNITYDPASAPTGCMNQEFGVRVDSSSDDAEQSSSGNVNLSSTDLELVTDGSSQTIGIRFNNVQLNQGSTVGSAYLEFAVDETGPTEATSLTIKVQDDSNPATFTTAANNIGSRSTTGNVGWTITDPWSTEHEIIRSPDISSLVNAVLARGDWVPGNSMAFIISGSGERVAESYDGSNLAPRLVYYADPSTVPVSSNTVRSKLIEQVNNLEHKSGTPIVDALYEAALYYRGDAVDYGKVRGGGDDSAQSKTRVSHPNSYTGGTLVRPTGCNEDDLGNTVCADEEITGSPMYTSPITESCQSNHIVLLTDGYASVNTSAAKVRTLTGDSSCIDSGSKACGPELISYLKNSDQHSLANDQHITTHTIGFNFSEQWLRNLANTGGGGFYEADSAAELTNAFDTIIKTVKAANTTFVEPSVTINQFNRFAHRDDVYFALFKPMETAKWFGNLKKYQLKGNPATLYDSQNPQQPAIDPTTGFFSIDSQSFWSQDEDGNQVEKGGAASKLPTTRKIYSLIDTTKALTADENKVHESNSLITLSMLDIASQDATYRTNLLKWTRGLDENDAPRYELGDPLHSRPELVTYAGLSNPIESTIFFGTNEGFIHAVDINTGIEQFAFIPQELLGNLDTYYTNLSVDPRPYGMDGGITLWTKDHNKDGDLKDTGDFAYLYAGMRRGGRNYYALDVTNLNAPTFKWQISGGSGDFVDLGQTWSQPVKSKIKLGSTVYDVLIFGGGYDTNQDNVTVRTADGVGNAIYIVDANTGALIWSAGNHSAHDETHADMDYSIPSKINVIDMNRDGMADQLYVGDMGGQIWRIDLDNTVSESQLNLFGTITKIADLAGSYDSNGSAIAAQSADNRRFYYPPDLALAVEGSDRYLSLAIGSGYRAHPLNTAIEDRFYMIKLFDTHAPPSSWTTLTEADLYDTTNNYISEGDDAQKNEAAVALSNSDVARKDGWMIRMTNSGEKVLAGSATIQNQIVFTTYEPTAPSSGSCNPAQGTSRAYLVSLFDATPMLDINGDGNTNAADRVIQLQIGSIPATPTVIDTLESKPTVWVGPERLDQVNTDVESVRTYWIEVNE
ncbi:VWA domain-containing protein [Motiliproteus coralliicola]|uniref:VWA domain-containing protein n=1 Tax=Motiliproteus coralliicola TaxID=2283196 RepID=A0A369WRD6_9GAMM|nr:PilC/PilY family type IV pilus protein [Motiliproteus coralliicola]RDE24101.1 VWA domain-containing protein [Motiliproteus coralliicola]